METVGRRNLVATVTASGKIVPKRKVDVSSDITGRIIHSSGYEVALYSNPEPVIRIVGTGPWDADALTEQVERSFGPLLGRQP